MPDRELVTFKEYFFDTVLLYIDISAVIEKSGGFFNKRSVSRWLTDLYLNNFLSVCHKRHWLVIS